MDRKPHTDHDQTRMESTYDMTSKTPETKYNVNPNQKSMTWLDLKSLNDETVTKIMINIKHWWCHWQTDSASNVRWSSSPSSPNGTSGAKILVAKLQRLKSCNIWPRWFWRYNTPGGLIQSWGAKLHLDGRNYPSAETETVGWTPCGHSLGGAALKLNSLSQREHKF